MWELTLKKSSGIYIAYRFEVLTANERCSGNILCGTTYRRVTEEAAANSNQSDVFQRGEYEHVLSSRSGSQWQLEARNSSENSVNDEMQHYTRLHILTRNVTKVLPTNTPPSRAPRIEPGSSLRPFRLWYCHKCNSGPFNISVQIGCTSVFCRHSVCSYCRKE